MKTFLSMLAVVFTLGLATVSMEAEAAKRMGSGKSVGTQRQAVQDKAPAAPAAQNAAPAAGAGAAAASKGSMMGPLAGLAAGLGIAALASHFGFGDELASMVMMGLLVFAVLAVVGFFLRKRAQAAQGGMAAPAGFTPAAAGAGHGASNVPTDAQQPAYKVSMPANVSTASSAGGSLIGADIGAARPASASIPADFDRAAFERNAKVQFIRLQAAYDAGKLDDIREFTTPEMFAELKLDLAERESGTQHGEVLRVDAQVLEVVEEAQRYLVSVQFTGFIRYGAGSDDETFDEIWHLTKPRQGNGGWTLAGIQQAD
ncbi:Tim44-like domain-containing protein [Curvibacter sp. APW13]|uniref:Tim44 domain-containing protein n=1 Tax=Curvibacter sp. APW13 TaxID=3077236 RepID=UPI0028DEEE26|nr:Tim44-like domain-containing protein [Curvibacter sp. APW13]MDT8989322.1 Tim44-like domain-containing protein [Curvibacter sp. APW13]